MRYLRAIRTAASDLYLMLVTYLPGRTGQRLRNHYWKRRLRHLGQDVRIDQGVQILNPKFVSIGDRSWIDRDVTILAGPDLSSRERTVIANADYPGDPGVVHIGKCVHIGVASILSGISAGFTSQMSVLRRRTASCLPSVTVPVLQRGRGTRR